MPKQKMTQRADGRYQASITLPTGKRKFVYGKTPTEVEQKLKEVQADIIKGTWIEPSKMTLGQWIKSWMSDYKDGIVTSGTNATYISQMNKILNDDIADITLQKLKPMHIQGFINRLVKEGCANNYTKSLSKLLKQSLKKAQTNELVLKNAADSIELPTTTNSKIEIFSKAELDTFLEAAKGHKWELAYKLMSMTGVRRGECLGLTWDAIDYQEQTLTIKQQVNKEGGQVVVNERTKGGDTRTIPLPVRLIAPLKAHRKAQIKLMELFETDYRNNNLVFAMENGQPINPNTFAYNFQRILEQAGLKRVTPHALRHTFASLLISQGRNLKVVQELLGHKDLTMTANVYAHLMPGDDKAAIAALEALFD